MQLTQLAESVITGAHRVDPPFGLYVLDCHDPGAELARSVEAEVFMEFFGNTPELLESEYGAYEEASLFLCVLDHRRRTPAGMMRVITPSEAGFKSLDDIGRAWGNDVEGLKQRSGFGFAHHEVWDIATLAVSGEYRGEATAGLVSLALYQALGTLATRHGVRGLVTILDVVVLELIQTRIERPFTAFAGLEPREYLDSPASLPVFCNLADHMDRISITDPAMYELLYEGTGLESVVSAPAWGQLPLTLLAPTG